MIIDTIITGCYFSCPFFNTVMQEMECTHPYWNNKNSYDRMIITQDNSRGGIIPEKCPLREESLIINYTLYNIK